MDEAEIRRLYQWIQSRVALADTPGEVAITFAEPTAADFAAEGFDDEAVRLTHGSSWWSEMAADIVETPEYAEPGESRQQILEYARDVVKEYVAKRLYT